MNGSLSLFYLSALALVLHLSSTYLPTRGELSALLSLSLHTDQHSSPHCPASRHRLISVTATNHYLIRLLAFLERHHYYPPFFGKAELLSYYLLSTTDP